MKKQLEKTTLEFYDFMSAAEEKHYLYELKMPKHEFDKIAREKLEKYFDLVKVQLPGLAYKRLRSLGPDRFGPEYEISHPTKLGLARALVLMHYICCSVAGTNAEILAAANEYSSTLSDAEVLEELAELDN